MAQGFYEQREKKKASQKATTAKRAANRKKFKEMAAKIQEEMRAHIVNCGLTKTAVSVHSGAMPSTISRMLKKYHAPARLETIVAVLYVSGYKLEIVPIDPKDDEYRAERMVHLPPA